MLPDAPIRLPTLVRSMLSNMNPSATRAKPEYALRTVTRTGMSAPPIAAEVVQPLREAKRRVTARHMAPMAGAAGANGQERSHTGCVGGEHAAIDEVSTGQDCGLGVILPASFRKARIDPVKVTPPIKTPRYAVVMCKTPRWPACPSTLPAEVITAARPTTLCSAATVCGSCIGLTRRPNREAEASAENDKGAKLAHDFG